MAVKVVELHHHGVRIGTGPTDLERARTFYTEVLGLGVDPGRPDIPGIPGLWLDVGGSGSRSQIHLMATAGISPLAASEKQDPTLPHVALAVEDIDEAERELARMGVWQWRARGIVDPSSDQIFVRDPFGNVIELHQVGACGCNKAALGSQPGRAQRNQEDLR